MPAPEVVVLGRLLHTGHCSSIFAAGCGREQTETQLAAWLRSRSLGLPKQELADAARADRWMGACGCGVCLGISSEEFCGIGGFGYVGGALVLGAVIMLGTLFWEDLGTTGRKAVRSHPSWCLRWEAPRWWAGSRLGSGSSSIAFGNAVSDSCNLPA